MMRVIKRNGDFEDVSFDKVLNRLQVLSSDLKVNVYEIAQKVCTRIFNGVKTTELDELAAQMCSSMLVEHPEYGKLASRIIVSNHHKNTSPSFSETIQMMFDNKDIDGEKNSLISDELYEIVMKNKEKLNSYIDYNRDYDFDYFGFKTLERSYLLKINGKVVERPQHMWMRVALGIHGPDFKDALQTYDYMSKKYFTHATPTLFNAGTPRPQCSSCYLLSMNSDSLAGIYESLQECAIISKHSGGIGIHMHQIRAKGSRIRGTNGTSDGIIPMLRVYNNTARYCNQGGKRNGSIAVYLEPWHADVEKFIELRKNHGNEEERCRDLFIALWVPDLFMKRVKANSKWSLMCPDRCPGLSDVYGDEFEALYEKYEREGKFNKQVNAQDLWFRVLESQIETGIPYILFKDSINKKSNQKNLGTIKSSNLCVAGDTMILTSKGYFPIKELQDQDVEVWNGKQWSMTTPRQTGQDQKLVDVNFTNGMTLKCTPYHKFYIETSTRPAEKSKPVLVAAKDLTPKMRIIRFKFECIPETKGIEMKYPYTSGLFAAEGTYNRANANLQKRCEYQQWNGTLFCKRHQNFVDDFDNFTDNTCHATSYSETPLLWLYGEKKKLMNFIDYTSKWEDASQDRLNFLLPKDIDDKYTVPVNHSIHTKLRWLEGYLDGDGCVITYVGLKNIQVTNTHKSFLDKVFYLLQTLGVNPTFCTGMPAGKRLLPNHRGQHQEYDCTECYRLNIDGDGVIHLKNLGFAPKRLDIVETRQSHHKTNRFVMIKDVQDNGEIGDTFCFNEPKEHKGVFNGILTGQCVEICEYSSPDEIAVCNLSSICIPTYIDKDGEGRVSYNFEKLHEISKVITKNLNKVIDRNFYPLEKARRSNLKHRPIGIGIQGLADAFVILRLPFESPEAKELNRRIFETIYHGALEASMEISKKRHELIMEARDLGESPTIAKYDAYLHLNEYELDFVKTSSHPGAYSTFKGSPASKGLLQFDLWGTQATDRYDWGHLKEDIIKYGIRNSLLVAPMPTASTAQIMGFNESFEPFTSNIYKRKTLGGEFIVVNKYLMQDLIDRDLWNKDMKDMIILNDGSVQNIKDIPKDLRELYKTVWEIKQKNLIDMSADRGVYICQSQSLNLFMEEPDFKKLTSMHFYSWERSLKSGCYYLRTKPRAKTQQFTIDPRLQKEVATPKYVECTEEACLSCGA